MRTFEVDILRVGGNDIGSHVAGDVENLLVVLERVKEIDRRIIKFIFVNVVLLFEVYDPFHERVIEVEPNLRMIAIIICHNYFEFCL